MIGRPGVGVGLATLLLVSALGCPRAAPPPEEAAPAGTLRLGYPAEPATLDPLAPGGGAAPTRDLLRPVLPSLFGLDADLRPFPELAAGWPGTEDIGLDPFSVRLELRDAAWSDGVPITAGDVRFSFERLREGPTGARYRMLRDVEVLGPRELVLRFERPLRRWWALFSVDDMVLPAHAYSEDWGRLPSVSGGPFRAVERVEGLSVRLVANEAHQGSGPGVAEIEVLFVPDEETRLQLLERGELDLAYFEGDGGFGHRLTARGFPEREDGLQGGREASAGWGALWWELALDPRWFGERPEVAEAVRLAADRHLATEILAGDGQVMDGIPHRFGVPGPRDEGLPALPGPWPDADPEAARKLLLDAGYDERDGVLERAGAPVVFRLAYARNSATAAALARFLHFRLLEVGVRVELAGVDLEVLLGEWWAERHADAYLLLRRGADAPDPTAYLPGDGPGAGPEAAAPLIELAESATSLRRLHSEPVAGLAAGAWAEAQRVLAVEGHTIPLVRARSWLAGEGVSGPLARGSLAGPLWDAHDWRYPNTRQAKGASGEAPF